MKKTVLAVLAGLPLALAAATSTPQGFTDDLDAALARAKESGKYVYTCFSGSDWCGWCIRLEKEVFSDAAFAPAVAQDYELVFIDMPRNQARLSDAAKARNAGLVKKYKVSGFPTMIVFDAKDGSEVVRTSAYRQGGATAYAEYLKSMRKDDFKQTEELKNALYLPLTRKYEALMGELNTACGKAIDAELAKPENAGKTRDSFSRETFLPVTMPVVTSFIPKFKALLEETRETAKKAPNEVKPTIEAYAQSLESWISSIESRRSGAAK